MRKQQFRLNSDLLSFLGTPPSPLWLFALLSALCSVYLSTLLIFSFSLYIYMYIYIYIFFLCLPPHVTFCLSEWPAPDFENGINRRKTCSESGIWGQFLAPGRMSPAGRGPVQPRRGPRASGTPWRPAGQGPDLGLGLPPGTACTADTASKLCCRLARGLRAWGRFWPPHHNHGWVQSCLQVSFSSFSVMAFGCQTHFRLLR